MNKTFSSRIPASSSKNPKSKIANIANIKFLAEVFALVLALVGLAGGVEAQQPKKIPRIGYLSSQDPAYESARAEGIRQALRDLGYIEGQNIAIEYRYSEGKTDRASELVTELVRLKVDILVVAGGLHWIRAAKETKTIPVVMAGVGNDPVEAGLIESLARPGGNVTGLTNLTGKLAGKRLELLKEAVPKLARVAVLYEPATAANVIEVKEDLPVAARVLKLTVQPWEVRAAEDFDGVFEALSKQQRPDGLYVAGSPLTNASQKRLVSFTLKSRLPSMYSGKEAVDGGGLVYYGADIAASYRRVAYYVDRILKGAKPADLPVEQPKKFEFIVNLKAAKVIGLTIPPNVLARADRVIR